MSTSFQTFLVCLLFALWGTGNVYSQVADPSAGCTRTFTSDEDFNEGLLLSVNTSVSGSLRLDQPGQPLPFVYIPCSARGTVVRINVVTGEIVGEYASAQLLMNLETYGYPIVPKTAQLTEYRRDRLFVLVLRLVVPAATLMELQIQMANI
jgi:hypothetical protein